MLFVRTFEIIRFWINLCSIQIYCNDNQTRTFVSLSFAEKDTNVTQNLQYIVNQLDSCLKDFKLPCFYKVSTLEARNRKLCSNIE